MTTAAVCDDVAAPLVRTMPANAFNVDLFCGIGGWGEGAKAAGIPIHLGINHDDTAIEFHKRNHPGCHHHKGDAWKAKPKVLLQQLAWSQGLVPWLIVASAACTTHSPARGGELQISERVHMLGWCIAKWARDGAFVMVEIENVPEWQKWGPLIQEPKGRDRFGWVRHWPAKKKVGGGMKKARKDKCAGPLAGTAEADAFVAEWADMGVVVEPRKIVDPERVGEHYRRFCAFMERLGYRGEVRIRDAKDSGAGSTRKRLYQCWVNDGLPIDWPEATHGPEGSGLKPYVPAADSIDFTDVGVSIFDRQPKVRPMVLQLRGRKGKRRWKRVKAKGDGRLNELEPKTLTRCAQAIGKYILRTVVTKKGKRQPEPFVLKLSQSGVWDAPVSETLPTQTTAHDLAFCSPLYATTGNGEREGQDPRVKSVLQPFDTATAQGSQDALLLAALANAAHGSEHFRGSDVLDSVPTIGCSNGPGVLSAAVLIKNNGGVVGGPLTDPVGGITSRDTQGMLTAAVIPATASANHGGDDARCGSVGDPLGTIDRKYSNGVCSAAVLPLQSSCGGSGYAGKPTPLTRPHVTTKTESRNGLLSCAVVPCGGPSRDEGAADDNLNTVLTREDRGAVMTPLCISDTTGNPATPASDPLKTVLTGPQHRVLMPVVTHARSGGNMQDAAEPLWSPTTGNNCEFLAPVGQQYYSTGGMDQRVDAPLNAVVCKARHAIASAALRRLLADDEARRARARQVAAFLIRELGADKVPLNAEGFVVVVIRGVETVMTDILYRMFKPRELSKAMGFRESLELPEQNDKAVKLIGNAVSPVESETLLRRHIPGGFAGPFLLHADRGKAVAA